MVSDRRTSGGLTIGVLLTPDNTSMGHDVEECAPCSTVTFIDPDSILDVSVCYVPAACQLQQPIAVAVTPTLIQIPLENE